MELDPVEEIMLARLADFFAERVNYDTFYNPNDFYKKLRFWENMARMVGGSNFLDSRKFNDGNYDYDPSTGILDLLRGIYQTNRSRFQELLGFIINKLGLVATREGHDLDGRTTRETLIDTDKISTLNRYLSVFYLVLDHSARLNTATGILESRAEDRKALLSVLSSYPAEREAFLGAIERFAQGGSDSLRQSMDSCRNLIENLTKKMSGESEWRVALPKLVKSRTKQETVKQVHAFLSGYGIHGSEIPQQRDAELGLKLTEDVVVWIIKEAEYGATETA